MQRRDVVVIGGSAGSIESLKLIVGGLPGDFSASIFVVVHISPDSPSVLAKLLSISGPLRATSPLDQEQVQPRHIYVARPDHHLTIEQGRIRVQRGPRENRHRPAIDPLMRTAARQFGPRVIGVVLSGLQDDGSAGLFAVKQRGGIAIVQDPSNALWKQMPRRAIEYANPQYVLPVGDIAPTLVALTGATDSESAMAKKSPVIRISNGRNRQRKPAAKAESGIPDANEEVAFPEEGEGTPSVFACPECHGVLWELKDDKMVRFRCRVGHSYGSESLRRELSSGAETALWAAVRALEEKGALQRRLAENRAFDCAMKARLLDQSNADAANAHIIRDMIFRQDAALDLGQIEAQKTSEARKRKSA